ncbi:MAG: aspartate aminotransferase family protein [Clostridiales bacterium]|nr:aspartate aminotransferase family protein [Clostridiales bacterium]
MNFNKIKETELNCYMPVFSRENIAIERGKGNCLYDIHGNKYVDFVAGIATNILGYNHPEYTQAVCDQVHKLMHVSNHYYTAIQSEYIKRLCDASGFSRVFLCNSGAEANECAIKLARRYFKNNGENKIILSAEGAFHGRTLATLTATDNAGQHRAYAPLPEGFDSFKYNDFDDFKAKLTSDVGAVILETVQGERGVRPFSNDFLINAYALCKSKGVLFIVDEVQTGMGRTGKLFSFEHFGIKPDIITLAKGIAGGIPMGACLASEEVGTAFALGDHGSTFGGNALACAAANKVLEILTDGGLLERSADVGEYFGQRLAHLSKYNFIKDIRGMGLMRGIQLDEKINAASFEGKLRERGYLVNVAGNNTLRFIPPLTITREEIDGLILALDDICASTNII